MPKTGLSRSIFVLIILGTILFASRVGWRMIKDGGGGIRETGWLDAQGWLMVRMEGLPGMILVTHSRDTLMVLDAGNPAVPRRIASLPLGSDLTALASRGNRIFAATRASDLRVYTLGDTGLPVLLGKVDSVGLVDQIVPKGGHAFLSEWSFGLKVADISRPESIGIVAGLRLESGGGGMVVWKNLAMFSKHKARVVDISDPLRPFLVGNLAFPVSQGIAVVGDMAYVPELPQGVWTLPLGSPEILSAPVRVGSMAAVKRVWSGGDVLFTVTTNRLAVFDAHDPARLSKLGMIDHFPRIGDVLVVGRHAFLCMGEKGIRILLIPGMSGP